MTTAVIERPRESVDAALVERVLLHGDLKQLTPTQKVSYYKAVCESVGLNPLTQPFQYLTLNGKEILYATRAATEQLRQVHAVSVQIMAREVVEDCYVVTARAILATGRQDENIGVVPIASLKGEARANAMMKAETKAKRRVTLAICGLGMLDETEVESIHAQQGYTVEAPAPQPSALPPTQGEREDADGRAAGDSRPQYRSTPNTGTRPEGLTIERVDCTPTKNPKVTKAFVAFSDGTKATTIKTQLIALCEQLAQENSPVTIETEKTKWGLGLLAVHRVMPPEFAPVNDEDALRDEPPF